MQWIVNDGFSDFHFSTIRFCFAFFKHSFFAFHLPPRYIFQRRKFFFEATKCNLSVTYFGYLVPFRTIHIPIPWQLEMLLDKNDDGRLSFGCLVHFNTYNTNSFMCKQTNYLVRSQKSVYWILNENEKKTAHEDNERNFLKNVLFCAAHKMLMTRK